MAFPAECPICKTVLTFPTSPSTDPVKCPACNSRFIIEGRRIAHLSFTDYYKFLGLLPSADEAEIKKAVRAKVLEHHPDRNPGDPNAADRLREVIQAKELLTDPDKRRIYDGVFNARALPRWAQAREEPVWQPERDRTSRYRAAPEARDSRYEEILSEARNRSKRASEENIDHLISEIEDILSSRGLGTRVAYKSREAQTLRSAVWGVRGAVFLGGAFLIVGLFRGTLLGATTLGLLGAIIGWILGSNASAVASLIFLGARILFTGLFLGILISMFNMPSTGIRLFEPFTSLTLTAVAGMLILGLYRIGVEAMSGKYRSSLRFVVARNGTLGAWLGGLTRMSMIYAVANDGGRSEAAALAWFILFSLYLLLDLNLFNRPIVVLY